MRSLLLAVLVLVLLCLVHGEVIQVITVARHGSRSPLFKDRPTFVEGGALLTPVGMSQCFESGQYFHDRYLVDTAPKFINEWSANYSADDLWVQSTDTDRTLSSAYAVTLGLHPIGTGPVLSNGEPALPERLQPVPVHSNDLDNDAVLRAYQLCPKFGVSSTQLYQSIEFLNKEMAHKDLFMSLDVKLNRTVHLADIWNIFDELNVEREEDYDLWYDTYQLTDDEWTQIIELADWHEYQLYKHESVHSYLAGPFFNELGGRINAIVEQVTNNTVSGEFKPKKMIWYSAHYASILSVTNTLALDLDDDSGYLFQRVPGYAATLTFEVDMNLETGDVTVETLFLDGNRDELDMISLQLPGCSSVTCPLNEFLEVIGVHTMSNHQWCAACDNDEVGGICGGYALEKSHRQSLQNLKIAAIAGVTVGVIAICALCCIVQLLLYVKKRQVRDPQETVGLMSATDAGQRDQTSENSSSIGIGGQAGIGGLNMNVHVHATLDDEAEFSGGVSANLKDIELNEV